MPPSPKTRSPQSRVPKYRDKNGYGHCRLKGRDHYFGRFQKTPPPEYWDLIALYKSGRLTGPAPYPAVHVATAVPSDPIPQVIRVEQLIDLFLDHARIEYARQDGTLGSEYDNYRQALRPLFTLYADEPAAEFTPKKFKRLQEHAVSQLDWCRSNANKQFSRVKSLLKWAVSEELIPANVYHAVQTVRSIKPGRLGVRETERVEMVDDAVVERTLSHLSATIADMVRLHRQLGGRSQDICNLRWCDIDRREPDVWLYRPPKHKQAWRGQIRTLYVEAEAQVILRKYDLRPTESFIFSPREAERQRRDAVHRLRKTPRSSGNRPGKNRVKDPKLVPGDVYTPDVYRRAITRACELAFPWPRAAEFEAEVAREVGRGMKVKAARKHVAVSHPKWVQEIRQWNREHHWFPHQLRHSAGTSFADVGGLEYSRMRLGHRHVRTTELYRTIQDESVIRKIRELKGRPTTKDVAGDTSMFAGDVGHRH